MKLNLRTCGPLTVLVGLLGCSAQDATSLDPANDAVDSTVQSATGEGNDIQIGEIEQAISYGDLTSFSGPGGIKCTNTSVIIGKVYYVHTPSNKVGFYYCAGNVSGADHGFLKINTGTGGGATGPAGATGPTGPQGAVGAAGPQGAKGANGTNGTNGTNGVTGPTGPQGASITGPQGAQGAPGGGGTGNGATGPQGATGAQGAPGAQGQQGAAGAAGPQGAKGADGAAGPQGAKGADGAAGPQGAKGADGAAGAAGPQGAKGADGAAGPQGAKGADGAQGATGGVGPAGAKAFAATSAPSAPTAACPNGEVTIRVGVDLNGNGTFDIPAEVTGSVVTCSATAACNAVCGNGVIDTCGGEVCDGTNLGSNPPANSACNATCTGFVALPPPPPLGLSATCLSCVQANCGDQLNSCINEASDPNDPASPAGSCAAVGACVKMSTPTSCAASNGFGGCFCGSADPAGNCTSGAADGPCKDIITAQSGCTGSSNVPQCVATNFTDPNFGLGDYFQVVNCARDACAAKCALSP